MPVLVAVLLLAAIPGYAQQYRSVVYQTADGLPTNLAKGAVEDEKGFLWIATDAGIIRYDGREFINYENGLNSSYPKGFLKTSDGELLIYHDAGISRIAGHSSQRLQLETLLPGGGNPGPATVNYPKALYEDHRGDIWISEVYSVARYNRQTQELERYFLPEQYRTSSFVRSFQFEQTDRQTLILSSQQGYLFYLDEQAGRFVRIPDIPDTGTINTLLREPETGAIWIGSANGIWAMHERTDGEETPAFRFEKISEATGISKLSQDARG
ncbi:MAG: ligand-binding sensor domain-containing protein, partial [Cyclonatronaceae bacterium]